MILRDFLKLVDPVGYNVRLFSQYDEDEPIWEGSPLDIPWVYAEKKIGRPDGDTEEPIWIYNKENEYGVTITIIVINIIE